MWLILIYKKMGFVHMYSKKIQPCYVNLIFVLFVATHTNYQTEEQYFRGGAAATEANQWRGSALLYTVTNQNRRGSGNPTHQLFTITAPSCPKTLHKRCPIHLCVSFYTPFISNPSPSLYLSLLSQRTTYWTEGVCVAIAGRLQDL